MANTSENNTAGTILLYLLGLLFVGLKLTGFIGWSWWWVLAPFWGPFALFLLIVFIEVAVKAVLK